MNDLHQIAKAVVERAGGALILSEKLGISHQAIYSWKRIPIERVREISALTGMAPNEIRPDIFVGAAE